MFCRHLPHHLTKNSLTKSKKALKTYFLVFLDIFQAFLYLSARWPLYSGWRRCHWDKRYRCRRHHLIGQGSKGRRSSQPLRCRVDQPAGSSYSRSGWKPSIGRNCSPTLLCVFFGWILGESSTAGQSLPGHWDKSEGWVLEPERQCGSCGLQAEMEMSVKTLQCKENWFISKKR